MTMLDGNPNDLEDPDPQALREDDEDDASMDLHVRHLTAYSYSEPVVAGQHRLMLRPRDSFDVRIIRTGLTITPAAEVSWMHDVYGNSVALVSFSGETDRIEIDSDLVLRRYRPTAPTPARAPWQAGAAIAYSPDESIVLQPFMLPASADEAGALADFAHSAVGAGTRSLEHPLLDLAQAIHKALSYQVRFEQGTQHPVDTLSLGTGSCRDYAWLFIECARRLGYAARFVTGYLHNVAIAAQDLTAPSVGYSHAWAEVYVPGDGWIEFDPTNLLVADRQLIRVAVTRTPAEAAPVSGSFTGTAQPVAPLVTVEITPIPPR